MTLNNWYRGAAVLGFIFNLLCCLVDKTIADIQISKLLIELLSIVFVLSPTYLKNARAALSVSFMKFFLL